MVMKHVHFMPHAPLTEAALKHFENNYEDSLSIYYPKKLENIENLQYDLESEYADSGHTYYCQKPKAGDKVKCTDACADPRLKAGEIYTVTYVNLDGSVRLGGIGHVHYYLERFKLVERVCQTSN